MKAAFVLILTLLAVPAAAQDRPLLASHLYLSAALADVATTGLAARQAGFYEGNPMYGWVIDQDAVARGQRASVGQVGAVMAMSAAVDLATVYAVNKWVAPHHPTLAKALYLVGVGVRGSQAVVNVQVARGRSHGF